MAEPLRDNIRMYSQLQELRSVRVAQVVEPYLRQPAAPHQTGERRTQRIREDRLPERSSAHESVVLIGLAQLEPHLALFDTVLFERGSSERRQRNAAPAPGRLSSSATAGTAADTACRSYDIHPASRPARASGLGIHQVGNAQSGGENGVRDSPPQEWTDR